MMSGSQLSRALAIAEKDIRIYYLKGPVLIYGILFPMFLFLAFFLGRGMPVDFLISWLLSMTLFFTATAVSPVILPWEGSMRTLERLISAPVSIPAILLGDALVHSHRLMTLFFSTAHLFHLVFFQQINHNSTGL